MRPDNDCQNAFFNVNSTPFNLSISFPGNLLFYRESQIHPTMVGSLLLLHLPSGLNSGILNLTHLLYRNPASFLSTAKGQAFMSYRYELQTYRSAPIY